MLRAHGLPPGASTDLKRVVEPGSVAFVFRNNSSPDTGCRFHLDPPDSSPDDVVGEAEGPTGDSQKYLLIPTFTRRFGSADFSKRRVWTRFINPTFVRTSLDREIVV